MSQIIRGPSHVTIGNGGNGGAGGASGSAGGVGGNGGTGLVFTEHVFNWIRPKNPYLGGFMNSKIFANPEVRKTMEVLDKMLPKIDEKWGAGQWVCVIMNNRPPAWYKVGETIPVLRDDNELAEAEANLLGVYKFECEK